MALNGKSFATSADGVLREIHEGQVLRTVNLPAAINGCALSRSGKLLLTVLGGNEGGTCGSVVGVRLPLTAPPQIVSTAGHNAPITRVQMNNEETLLFTGGDDGLVMVWQVSDREGKNSFLIKLGRKFKNRNFDENCNYWSKVLTQTRKVFKILDQKFWVGPKHRNFD